jgi:oxygen-independent coproporphyrinogen-3 oxidase
MEQIPRYTSYPTAPHFHKGVDGQTSQNLLGKLGKKDVLSLYFHIPFCRQLCWFCGCHTKIVNGNKPIEQYMELLSQEIAMQSKLSGANIVKYIHFGGGSPTVIEPNDFIKFMNVVRSNFDVLDDAEIAVEIDPRTVSKEKILAYAKSGVNRASLGVQDFNEQVQRAINRHQSFELVKNVVDSLRGTGINEINFDLIYGLPFQSLDTIKKTIDSAVKLDPNRISLFGYAHVPWMKKHQDLIPSEALPGPELRIEMFDFAHDYLIKSGYVSIGLDHFVKPDDSLAIAQKKQEIQRNFQGYTIDKADALLGFGVSSISTLSTAYLQNSSDYRHYATSIEEGNFPVARGIELSDDDIKRRDIIMSIMCGIRTRVCSHEFASELKSLSPFIKNGTVEYTDGYLIMNKREHHQFRKVAAKFDAYLTEGQFSFSQAV